MSISSYSEIITWESGLEYSDIITWESGLEYSDIITWESGLEYSNITMLESSVKYPDTITWESTLGSCAECNIPSSQSFNSNNFRWSSSPPFYTWGAQLPLYTWSYGYDFGTGLIPQILGPFASRSLFDAFQAGLNIGLFNSSPLRRLIPGGENVKVADMVTKLVLVLYKGAYGIPSFPCTNGKYNSRVIEFNDERVISLYNTVNGLCSCIGVNCNPIIGK